ncbi:telomere-associated protein RIF1 [Scaptodrosophila lebanonensis]|uniref:Telomere-associated protein RIF1 n=1 Tax=Drosophila lebanonensis TaxID=7225 RepID=A0A6J2UFI8_DROLE|nr:telomere-associated protein RIF1 [Scaptodrosophila lebanonensis]
MDREVGQAYHTVQLSTKEMLKNNRRQNLSNMIDLLASSCKASGLIATSFTNDELIEFWLKDILPLMFDSERSIQTAAIAAMSEALVALDVSVIHSTSVWPQIRSEFINKYTTLISEMRDAKNSNWHKIWTLLVQIMDEELLRGCTYINKFLAVVEMGFRNADNGVRSEAFLCWRVLIKIFAAYNELAASKRLRLLLIPLRTSQSRSSHVTGIKLRVWWYLLTCLEDDLPKAFDNAVEYFLSLVFGGGARGQSTGLVHNYQTARELALPCLVSLWSLESNDELRRILRELRLEALAQPSPLMQSSILQQHWRPLLAAAVVGMQLMNQNDSSSETEEQLLHMLVRNLTLAMFQLRQAAFIIATCAELEKTLATSGRVVRIFFNTCASESLVMKHDQGSDYLDVLEACMKLCIKAKGEVPPAVLQRCLTLIFSPEELQAHNQNDFRQLISFAELLMQSNDEEDYVAFGVKLHIWRQLTSTFVSYLRENALEYRLTHNATLLDSWLLWPLQTCVGFAGRRAHTTFDSAFCEQWRQLLNAGHNAPDRKNFVGELKNALKELLKSSKEELCFPELFEAYVGAVVKLGICKDAPIYKDVFALLMSVFEQQALPQKSLEGCLNTLRNLILELRQNELMVIFDALKPTLAAALQCWNKHKCEGSFLIEWKRAIQEKFRKQPMKSMTNQLKDLFKGDDLFVIIPSVWSLDPDKLTERQKERFAEKSDIPALYNDMSQSQDSSIKPWTPKKVVIAKSKQAELAIGGDTNTDSPIVIEDTPNDEPFAFTTETPKRRRQTDSALELNSTDKYKFRKPRALGEEDSTSGTVTRTPASKEETPVRLTRQRSAATSKDVSHEKQESVERQERSPTKHQPSDSATIKVSTMKVKSTTPALDTAKSASTLSEDLFSDIVPTQLPELSTKASSVEETQLMAPKETLLDESAPPPAQTVPEINIEPIQQMQETSPKKPPTRLCNLNSPPDRKQTNNSTSPTLRPKPTAHLTGRGAQLINMIRNKKLDSCSTSSNGFNSSRQVTPARMLERTEMVSTPTAELNELIGTEQTSTPIQQPKDLLIFSKRLPSPSASPSASILKRKLRCESIDEMSIESPALKRKRVSFHDPPVSVTKEYLRDTEERSNKPKRCLLLDNKMVAQTPDMKHALKRRGRLDSIIEIEKFAKEQTARTALADKSMDKSTEMVEDDAFTTLKWNDTHNNSAANTESNSSMKMEQNHSVITTAEQCRDLSIMDADKALDLVLEQCSLETVLERYFRQTNTTPYKSANVVTKFLSAQMSGNHKMCTNVLETLSENHSKDFLDHAVRENLSSVVCDRLNPNSVLDYIFAKSKINSTCRSNLLAQVPDVLKSSRVGSERKDFVQELLLQCSFNDEQLLDIIGQLMRARETREHNSESVAETAADSSSNL